MGSTNAESSRHSGQSIGGVLWCYGSELLELVHIQTGQVVACEVWKDALFVGMPLDLAQHLRYFSLATRLGTPPTRSRKGLKKTRDDSQDQCDHQQ